MGAAPDWKGPRPVVSPLREVERYTVSVASPAGKPGPQRFARVPTHAIGVASERRSNPRASLSLPLRLTRVGDHLEPIPVTLVTRNISSSGVYFLAPRDFQPGTAIELEVALIERGDVDRVEPLREGNERMTQAGIPSFTPAIWVDPDPDSARAMQQVCDVLLRIQYARAVAAVPSQGSA